jgi:hypothetical protein
MIISLRGVFFVNTLDSFLQGIKPAYLCNQYQPDDIDTLIQSNYPHVLCGGNHLFFQNESLKAKYLADMRGVAEGTWEDVFILGVTLGYPPLAARFFADAVFNESLDEKRAFFHYAGLSFAGSVEDDMKIASWLWLNINYPASPVEISYRGDTYHLQPHEILPQTTDRAIL